MGWEDAASSASCQSRSSGAFLCQTQAKHFADLFSLILGSLAGDGLSEPHFTDEGTEGLPGQAEMRQGLLSGRKRDACGSPL